MNKNYLFFVALLLSLFCKAQIGLHFNGTNSVTSNASPVLNNQSRTVDAWIKTTSTITTQMVIADWGVLSPNGSRFTLNIINSRVRIEVGGFGITGNTVVNTGQWVHVTAVYEPAITVGNNVFIYINGVLDVSGVFTGYSVLTTANTVGFRLGARVDGINLFVGAIDEVKVYNYARTQAQVAADTVEYCGPQPGLMLYYKLNEGLPGATNTGSTTCIDYSGNNNNGTLSTNFALTGTVSNWVPGRVNSIAPVIISNAGNSVCNGASLSLSAAAAPGTYTWSTGNTTSTLITISPTTTTIYSIAITSTQNCIASSSIAITVFQGAPVLTVTTLQNPICLGASTSFSASGASTYIWSGGLTNGQLFSPTASSSYTLNASNSCGAVSSVHSITVNPVPVQILSTTNSVCVGSTATLTASSTLSGYTWAPIPFTGSLAVVSPSSATIYSVTASNGTCIGTQTLLLNTLPSPNLSIQGATATPFSTFVCAGQTYTATVTSTNANISYTWLPTGGNAATAALTPTASSVYTVIGTGANGCSGNAVAILVLQATPNFSIFSNRAVVCAGQSATLTTNATGTYTWGNGSSTASIIVNPAAPSTTFSLTASSLTNTCSATKTINVSVLTPTANYTSSLTICDYASATLSASGANSYSWHVPNAGNSASVVITPTSNSTFSLTVFTSAATLTCFSTYISSVSVLPSPTIAISGKTITCKFQEQVTLIANGASTYTWLNTSATGNTVGVQPSTSTTYTVVGEAANSCTAASTFNLRVVICPGFEEFTAAPPMKLWPNPSTDVIYISAQGANILLLYTISGQLIETWQVQEGKNTFKTDHIAPGIYYATYSVNQQQQILKLCID